MTTLVLALLALLLAGPMPWWLGRWPRLRRTPRAAMTLWQAVALAGVLAALGAGLSLFTHGLGDRDWFGYVVAALALLVTLVVLGRLLLSGHLVGTRLRRLRRRHRELVDLLAAGSRAGLSVLHHEAPMAYCLPGLTGSRVVLSDAALRQLDEPALNAVLHHERAHLRARHDLVLEAFTVLHSAFPALISSRHALEEVRLLVEVLADRAARAETGPRPLVTALETLACHQAPEATLGLGSGLGAGLQERLEVLLDPRPLRGQAALLYAASALILLLPTVLVVVPWLQSLR